MTPYKIDRRLHKTGCVVCGTEGVWSWEKLGTHRICIECHKLGFHFSSTQPITNKTRSSFVLNQVGDMVGEVRIHC